ncbi:MAG: tetratricopeptide repeat protein [Nitrospinae bacterium]|nr:tetratricopeptide repeat protein [Nitrospinota bacterium]MBL7020816.1 tetratricopeptide repeat protein [Nitrospinaceae bacterium]
MNSYSRKRPSYSVGHSIFYPVAKGLFVIFALSGIFESQAALAVDFKTYLQGARAEILRHKEIIRGDPLDAIAYFELGRAYLALGKHKEEVEAYQEAVQLNPKYIAAHYNLSMAYDLLKDGPNAIKHMLRALNLYSEKRNHARIRNVQRQLKRLYLKYPDRPGPPENLN